MKNRVIRVIRSYIHLHCKFLLIIINAMYSVEFLSSIKDADRTAWNRMASVSKSPFLEWEWLFCMEESGSISRYSGWKPFHALLYKSGRIAGAAPLFIKNHSEGEFIYDYFWQDAAMRMDLRWFPKIVGTVPATPSVAYEFLTDPDGARDEIINTLLSFIHQYSEENNIPNIQFNFITEEFKKILGKRGYSIWMNQLYNWENRNFRVFDDYLASFRKNQRRNIKREISSMNIQGYSTRIIRGKDITAEHAAKMSLLYTLTNNKFGIWAARFVNQSFFDLAVRYFSHRLLFCEAVDPEGKTAGLSMLAEKDRQLTGRYAGSTMFIKDLHFNFCYYSPIDYAIKNGISFFDPGAGSSHKIRRGFLAVPVYSAHFFRNPVLKNLFSANVPSINIQMQDRINQMNLSSPLKNP